MNKSFVSDIDRWIDVAGAWSNNSKGPSKCFSEGIEAASTINSILYNAPANVGGTISLGIRMSEVDELLSNWELMQNFSNSIHYEAADLIDIPYTKKVNQVMEDIYGLDPKDFRTEKTFLFWERGQSLQELLLSVVTTSSAKASYEAMIKALDTDMPDAKFDEVMKDANYWAAEYKKMLEISEYTKEFYDKYKDKWDTYTDDKKLKLLNDYAVIIGMMMDNTNLYGSFNGPKIVISVEYETSDPGYDPSKDYYGYTYPDSRNGRIYISELFRDSDNPLYGLSFAITTVIHEARHQYQGQADYNPELYNLPEEEQIDWIDWGNYPTYWTRPWEIDARAYSGFAY